MSHIRERDFRGIDLNLLVTLLVLLREKSVSRAATCLHLGQPAVSGALARLREVFKDELLVRSQGGMQPTLRALELQAALAPALESIQDVVSNAPAFDPATTTRTFTLGMPDWVDTWLLPALLEALSHEAPQMRLAVVTAHRFSVADMLARNEVDLGVSPINDGPSWLRSEPLACLRFCAIHRPQAVAGRGPLTLHEYVDLPHLMVSYRADFQGTVDVALEPLGLRRHVAYTSPSFSSLPRVLQRVPAVATVPEVLAPIWLKDHGLVSTPLPLELPSIVVTLSHHVSRDQDPALQWLRQRIAALVAELSPRQCVASTPGSIGLPFKRRADKSHGAAARAVSARLAKAAKPAAPKAKRSRAAAGLVAAALKPAAGAKKAGKPKEAPARALALKKPRSPK